MIRPRTRLANNAKELHRIGRIILPLAWASGVRNVRVFGSFTNGTQGTQSNLDLLVDLPDTMGLFALSSLKRLLEVAIQRKVDLVPAENIKPALRDYILAEARPL